jgi:hypothetical protein
MPLTNSSRAMVSSYTYTKNIKVVTPPPTDMDNAKSHLSHEMSSLIIQYTFLLSSFASLRRSRSNAAIFLGLTIREIKPRRASAVKGVRASVELDIATPLDGCGLVDECVAVDFEWAGGVAGVGDGWSSDAAEC